MNEIIKRATEALIEKGKERHLYLAGLEAVPLVLAVIEAMREPTAEMFGGGGAEVLNRYINADPADSYCGTATWADECWRAMIDVALSEDHAKAL